MSVMLSNTCVFVGVCSRVVVRRRKKTTERDTFNSVQPVKQTSIRAKKNKQRPKRADKTMTIYLTWDSDEFAY
jgi:hypothetical protein